MQFTDNELNFLINHTHPEKHLWLNLADLRDAKYGKNTEWSEGFDPGEAGAILVIG